MKLPFILFVILSSVISVVSIISSNSNSLFPGFLSLIIRNPNNYVVHLNESNDICVYTKNKDNLILYNQISNTVIRERGNLLNKTAWASRIRFKRDTLQYDLDFAKKLRQAQPNIEIPLVNDIVVSKTNDIWTVYVIINNGNTHNKTFTTLNDVNVTLIVDNKEYHNIFRKVKQSNIRVLKYIVPRINISGKLSLFDHSTNLIYKDLPYKTLFPQPMRKIAVCAYISNYNSAAELKLFLAYYLLQNIDNVIFYCSINCTYFKNLLKMEINTGYVILYEFPWPLTETFGKIQRSVQGSQINSCYYRHKNYFKYIISQDVDEYLYSELYPFDLYKAISKVYEINSDKRSLAVEVAKICYIG